MELAKSSGLSRIIQLTALLVFAFGLWRLWRYFTHPLPYPEYMLYAVLAATIIGVGMFTFDEVFKPNAEYVGWAFLLGVGALSIVFGLIFIFFPEVTMTNLVFVPFLESMIDLRMPTRSFFLILLGVIIIIESLLVKRRAIKGPHDINADTIAPILLKMTAVFTIAWGIYPLIWVYIASLPPLSIPVIQLWQLFLLGVGSFFTGAVILIWVETQKRKPHYRRRRLPLLISFLFVLTGLPVMAVYFAAPGTLLFPITLGIAIVLFIESFYIVYHPIKSR